MLKIQNIRCENKINPINIANEIPKFSWILFSNQQNVCQTGYQIKIWEGSKQIQDREENKLIEYKEYPQQKV